jgi:hypothetical protein
MRKLSGAGRALVPEPGHIDAEGFYRVSQWELFTGTVVGLDPLPAERGAQGASARQRLEEVLLSALQRPPCLIEFSGGRDSSALLCVVTDLARREGLPEPVAVTHDFTGHGAADESQWQELVVRHLALGNWERVSDADVFDVLGARARRGLLRYGLLWPALVHRHAPFAELARGGSLVVGEGGDEVLAGQRLAGAFGVLKRKRLDRKALSALARLLGPRWLRRALHVRDLTKLRLHPWLNDQMAALLADQDARERAREPLRWDRAVLFHAGYRGVNLGSRNIARVLADNDVTFHAPLLDPRFVRAWANEGGVRGVGSRTEAMKRLFGDVVPDEVCRRASKARFGPVAVGEASRTFLQSWDGHGVDPHVVDVEKFREACLNSLPGTLLLLQSAWLATQPALSADSPKTQG